ncbi:uncharacterized protein LOC108923467 isoform X2 [Scleropages formosus]|uniref:uncharacterized protein LOC108923467 isoform X2 n=1 Tax=Scleropages formosus TaxID=113540 RepID=UPI0008789A96|nr:uncharacterized protein LOC108923467 isoform X2 [Scleropages formosus]
MEQEGTVDFKSLQAKFQQEGTLRQIMSKPAIPEKPKVVPPSGSRNSLLNSINIAVENKMPVIPRVVFKEDKKEFNNKQTQSTPGPFKVKNAVKEPTSNTEVADNIQKKEGDIVKQAFKDKKPSIVPPVSVLEENSNPKLDPVSPVHSPTPEKAVLPSKPTKTLSIGKEFSQKTEGSLKLSSTSEPQATTPAQISVEDPKPDGGNFLSEIRQPTEPQSPTSYSSAQSPLPKKAAQPANFTRIESPIKDISQITEGSTKPISASVPTARTQAQIGAEGPKFENGNFYEISPPSELQSSSFYSSVKPTEGKPLSVSSVVKTSPCDRRVLKALEKAKQKASVKNVPLNEGLSNLENITKLHPEIPPVDYEHSLAGGSSKQLSNLPLISDMSVPPAIEVNGPSQKLKVTALKNPTLDDPLDTTGLKAPEGFDTPDFETSEFPDFDTSKFEAAECQGVFVPHHESVQHGAVEHWTVNHRDLKYPEAPHHPNGGVLQEEVSVSETPEAEAASTAILHSVTNTQSIPRALHEQSGYEHSVAHESTDKGSKSHKGQTTRKRKVSIKNPYADSKAVNENSSKGSWLRGSKHDKSERKGSPEGPSDKELKKKEKQRLEKEKKEQKEREKKENEMKKKFKITGQEEAMYQAEVIAASKGRKNGLPVKIGETVSIIRTTNCPKGMWLAKDSNNKYGYIPVKNVELDVKEMVELGKKATQAKGHTTVDGEAISNSSRNSNHKPLSTGSFSDESEEWTGDEEEPMSPTENRENVFDEPKMRSPAKVGGRQQDGTTNNSSTQAGHEAVRKLETFFNHQDVNSGIIENVANVTKIKPEEPSVKHSKEEATSLEQEGDSELLDMMILPPPELYADS